MLGQGGDPATCRRQGPPQGLQMCRAKNGPAMAPEPFQVAPRGRGNVGPGENSPIWSCDVVCLASCPQIKGINPAGSKSPGERPRLVPIRITPDLGTALAACGASEPFLDIRQPNVIRPSITAHPDIVAATIVLTEDQEPAHALGAEFGERDLLLAAV